MATLQAEQMANNSSQVHTTKDYFLFKPIDGNRNKNLLHINRLKKSMAENYLFTIIIVNENYEIIDGQHRFDVIKELNLPLNYIICKGYSLNEVHILNANSKIWNSDDYLNGYCNLGYEDYLKYREFKNTYNIGHRDCMTILKGSNNNSTAHDFDSGLFKIKNYSESCKTIEKILSIEPYYKGVRRRSFINCMLALFNNPNFDYNEFMQKIKLQQNALTDCVDIVQYTSLIEEIYNFRRRVKINLRY